MHAVIQTGKAVLIFVALAYGLVSSSAYTRWWNFIVEEIEAVVKVPPDLSRDQSTKQGQEKKQSSYGGSRQIPLSHPVDWYRCEGQLYTRLLGGDASKTLSQNKFQSNASAAAV